MPKTIEKIDDSIETHENPHLLEIIKEHFDPMDLRADAHLMGIFRLFAAVDGFKTGEKWDYSLSLINGFTQAEEEELETLISKELPLDKFMEKARMRRLQAIATNKAQESGDITDEMEREHESANNFCELCEK